MNRNLTDSRDDAVDRHRDIHIERDRHRSLQQTIYISMLIQVLFEILDRELNATV